MLPPWHSLLPEFAPPLVACQRRSADVAACLPLLSHTPPASKLQVRKIGFTGSTAVGKQLMKVGLGLGLGTGRARGR